MIGWVIRKAAQGWWKLSRRFRTMAPPHLPAQFISLFPLANLPLG